ncbi:MAG: DUF5060 domain-containing protein [Granulosicoccus sp.]
MRSLVTVVSFFSLLYTLSAPVYSANISGELTKWYPITLDFNGPSASESDDPVNPFLDYRLTVDLTSPSGVVTRVPGFFAGDGQGLGRGRVWRVRFSADEVGLWRYKAWFHEGEEIAVSLDMQAGRQISLEDSAGQFSIGPRNTNAPGFLKSGRLEYVGEHYMKFRDGPYWIKGGTDSPENLLGYAGFDGTEDQGGIRPDFLHDFSEHRVDFRPADPLFTNSSSGADSRGLIGALNYLGAQGVNSVYFLPMNLGGDGQETYPFVAAANNRFNKTHYDISKLYQWNLALNHAQEQGVALNIVLSETETENERWLDNGAMGVERKLFFRELIARFGYLMAVKWNLGEENDFRLEQLQLHAGYIKALDWSNKPIAVHTHINQFYRYGELLGDPRFSATSIQYDPQFAGQFVEQWRSNSAAAGHPWVLDMDENTNGLGVEGVDVRRKQILYDVLFSGGNIEWYFGYSPPPVGGDIDAGNFRYRESMWKQMRYAREFMEREMPFWRMQPADDLVQRERDDFGGAEVFALDGEVYAVYLPATNGAETLNMRGASGVFRQRWFNPRTGETVGAENNINASTRLELGNPPSQIGQDWVVLIDKDELSQPVEPVELPDPVTNAAPFFDNLSETTLRVGQWYSATLTATDSDGTYPVVSVGELPQGMLVKSEGNGQLQLDWLVPDSAAQTSRVELIAIDALDRSLVTRQTMLIRVINDDVQPSEDQQPSSDTGNLPRFPSIPSPIVTRGEFFSVSLKAEHSDRIAPVVTVGTVPPGMRVSGPGNGELRISWQVPDNAESLSIVELIAIDALNQSVRNKQEMVIRVSDQPQGNPGLDSANPPVLQPVSDVVASVGVELSIRIGAEDLDGVPPALTIVGMPDNSSFDDNRDGTRTFRWRPSESDLGRTIMTLVARDHSVPDLMDTRQLVIDVIR